jgi:hypothetical protein
MLENEDALDGDYLENWFDAARFVCAHLVRGPTQLRLLIGAAGGESAE